MKESLVFLHYLSQHPVLEFEHWGTLEKIDQPAQLDFSNKQLLPPSTTLQFRDQGKSSRTFTIWMQQTYRISAEQAQHWTLAFVRWFEQSLRDQGEAVVPAIGRFTISGSGLQFEQDPAFSTRQDPVPAGRIIRTGSTHQIRVGEDWRSNTEMEELLQEPAAARTSPWWLTALLLLLAAAGALIVFYSNHPAQWKHQGGFEEIKLKQVPQQYRE
ncbi:MAG TPA: hypothetical protein PKE63_02235 [Lacibacter sp.]|nr:hypothetical protein [Lacibacter sp.]